METTILRRLRTEAVGRLRFSGGWSGYWYTSIDGVDYRGELVSGFLYLKNDCGNFLQDAILHRVKLMRDKKAEAEARQLCGYGREYHISENGKVELW